MKRFFLCFILLSSCLLLSCGNRTSENPNIRTSDLEAKLQAYMTDYPQSQLCDVYKYCFQDYFGLEHLLTDSLAAVEYIEYELENSDPADWNRPLFCYPLLDSNYCRVDINHVRQGIIPMGSLVSAMLESYRLEKEENGSPSERLDEWRSRWSEIMLALKNVTPRPLNFEEDCEAIDELLSKGEYAFHHSRIFNEAYRQHYRIVRRDVLEKRRILDINL